jgi:sugar/nucleoside kinase (ribokinase family)
VTVPAAATTSFAHADEAGARVLTLAARAADLCSEHAPEDWADAPLVLLAPVIHDVDPLVANVFPEATLGAAIQGWLRETGAGGVIEQRDWESPEWLLGRVAALFASVEDVRGRENDVLAWVQQVPVAVLTAGAAGALLYVSGDRYEVPAVGAHVIDTTGAGDVFAATFLVWQHQGADAWEAARAASCAAALSIGGAGWSSVPDRTTLESAIAEYRRAADAAP